MKRRTAADMMRPVYPPREQPPEPPVEEPSDDTPRWLRWFLTAFAWLAGIVKPKRRRS